MNQIERGSDSSTNKIRIMYVIASMGDGLAGTEHNVHMILERLEPSEFEPHLVVLQDCPYVRSRKELPKITCLDLYHMFTPRMFMKRRALAGLMKASRIDLVQTFSTDAHLVGGGAARIAGVRAIISSRRDLGFSYSFKEKCYLRLANTYPHRVLANSNSVAEAISRTEHIRRDRIDVIYNGVEMRTNGQCSNKKSSVLLVANLRRVKSIATFIRAAEGVIKEVPSAEFVIVGDGPEKGSLENLARELGLREKIVFAGRQAAVHPFLCSASIGVSTSESEGFSNAILEYMAAGLPVVATGVGGNSETIVDGETGFLIPVADAKALVDKLIWLLQNPNAAIEMGRKGQERIHRMFSIDVMMQKYQDYYRNLVASKSNH